jgi:hypothetical protein
VPPRARASLLVVLGTLAGGARARAEVPATAHARLIYFVDPTATGCPSADELRAAVSARAGHELFGEPADVAVDVTIRRTDTAYVANVGLPGSPDTGAATRELRSEVGCAELASAAALVVSIALDPESIVRAPPPAPPAAVAQAAPAPRAPGVWRALVGLGPRGAWGLTPEPTAGLALTAASVAERGSFGVELGGLLANDAHLGRGSVSVLPLTLSLLPCATLAHAELCGVARLGLVRGAGSGFTEDFSTSKAFAAAGVRAGAFVDVGRLRFRAWVEGTGVVPTTSFVVGETVAYATRGVSAAGGLDALLFFE